MKKLILLLLWIFLLTFSLSSFYISYSAFNEERTQKIAGNLGAFLLAIPENKVVILPNPELTIIKVQKNGQIFMTANAVKPFDPKLYSGFKKSFNGTLVEVYVKNATLDDFFMFLVSNPTFGGLLAFVFILYISFFYFTVNELREVKVIRKAEKEHSFDAKEVINSLKALKVLLHTEKILKEESVEKAKSILDETIKKLENK
ncbi:hypothetical protein [Aquifex aeolicus]|uniref:hypothetical protein n=1 Tax=Aquifex aeolicus TaxID=63363 RepID=UPI00031C5625|nr:hypothetical protein [Aquifex aeolicus]